MTEITLTYLTVYMKHSYMTRNACTKQQDKKKKAACVLLEQRSIEEYSNLFVAGYTADFRLVSNTFSFQLLFSKPRREQQRFKYARPSYSRLRAVSCVKKVILPCLGHKTCSSLFLLAFFDLRWQNLSSLKAEQPSSE